MNSSQFMDKQIMELSGSQGGDFFDPNNGAVMPKEDILPSYDFQPIRNVGSSPSMNSTLDVARQPRGSADSKMAASNLRFSGILEPHELAKVGHERENDPYNGTLMVEIDRTVKKHADSLLHVLEGVSSRLSQLESRTHHVESSVDELKISIGNNKGAIDGKLGQLENILREVHAGMQVLRDKQEIAEAQLQLAKLQASKGDHPPSHTSSTGAVGSLQQLAPQQPVHQSPQAPLAPPPQPPPPPLPSLPAPNAPPPPSQHNPSVQFPAQLPQSQVPFPSLPRESYFPPPGQPIDTVHQQYQMPTQQLPPAQQYQSPPQVPQYSQPMQPPGNPSPQFQSPLPHQPEESAPYMPPPQTYNPTIRQPSPLTQPPSGPPPPQQYYGSHPATFEPPANRPVSGQLSFPGGYGPPSGPSFSELYPYNGSPSHYSGSMKQSPFSSSANSSAGSSYGRLPTAQILPQAAPSAGSSSGGATGDRVPVDDVVNQVATMGFSRDQVREAVRRLTENGQSVDLNVVLDKLMNDGEIQPQRGWFGR